MALPPIITNNPITRLFRTEQPPPARREEAGPVAGSSQPQDVVEISEAARREFGEAQLLADQEAQAVAEETRDILGRDETLTLGLDPGFQDKS